MVIQRCILRNILNAECNDLFLKLAYTHTHVYLRTFVSKNLCPYENPLSSPVTPGVFTVIPLYIPCVPL